MRRVLGAVLLLAMLVLSWLLYEQSTSKQATHKEETAEPRQQLVPQQQEQTEQTASKEPDQTPPNTNEVKSVDPKPAEVDSKLLEEQIAGRVWDELGFAAYDMETALGPDFNPDGLQLNTQQLDRLRRVVDQSNAQLKEVAEQQSEMLENITRCIVAYRQSQPAPSAEEIGPDHVIITLEPTPDMDAITAVIPLTELPGFDQSIASLAFSYSQTEEQIMGFFEGIGK